MCAILLSVGLIASAGCTSSAGKAASAQRDDNENVKLVRQHTNISFDVDTAMTYLKRQVDFGPRVPGSLSHRQCADWLAGNLKGMGYVVTDHEIATTHPVDGHPIKVRNIFAQSNPDATDRVIILAHYDTRPWADHDADSSKHTLPIDGANDGASGVAVALEIARSIGQLPKDKGLDILLVDQEDSGTYNDDDSWCIGSRVWADNLPYTGSQQPRFAILLDMVGGKDAVFRREYFSQAYAAPINDIVWNAAKTIGHGARFVDEMGGAINDDHIPLLRAGIPTIDIIETNRANGGFNPTWHTTEDNIDNIDPATIRAVGEVITHVIQSQYDN